MLNWLREFDTDLDHILDAQGIRPNSMIACFDVHYEGDTANAAAIVFRQWKDSTIIDQFAIRVANVGKYRAGRFYQRELKPLRELLEVITYPIRYFVIDAYCHLSGAGSPGLGAHLHRLLSDNSVVVGVAKNRYRNSHHAIEILRGGSERPLFITSIGIDYRCAADHVQSMAGEHRMPTMLKTVDRLSRNGAMTQTSHATSPRATYRRVRHQWRCWSAQAGPGDL